MDDETLMNFENLYILRRKCFYSCSSEFIVEPHDHCTEVRNGRFSSGGGILSQLQWYQSDIQKLGFPRYEIKDN